jgi:hypothetical protein
MLAIDIISFILIFIALGAVIYLLHRSEVRDKNKHKLSAYNLLEEKNPDPKKVKDTIRILRLYGGRFRKDQECEQLEIHLNDLLDETEKSGRSERQVKR